jgi:hypothetical protein
MQQRPWRHGPAANVQPILQRRKLLDLRPALHSAPPRFASVVDTPNGNFAAFRLNGALARPQPFC